MSELKEFLMEELLTNRIVIIAKTIYNREVSVSQIAYVTKCVQLMSGALKQHVTDWDTVPFTVRENKIIETLSGSFISCALKIAFQMDEINELKNPSEEN